MPSARALTISVLMLASCSLGCDRNNGVPAPHSPAPAEVDAQRPAETQPDARRRVLSNDGLFEVSYSFATTKDSTDALDAPRVNEPFVVLAVVSAKNVRLRPGEIVLSIDAAMPEHGHGMNVEPRVSPAPENRPGFIGEGLLFHMPGRWELYFDITREGLTSRAQDEITLE
jgi:hypothetical protein